MSSLNPIAGGPAFICALRNALEGRTAEFCEAPRTGGKQHSIRLDDTLAQHIDIIAQMTGWNRTEIFSTLIERGLFDLYGMTNDQIVNRILEALELSSQDALLWREVKIHIQTILSHFSRRNEDIDDWECAHLSEAVLDFRMGRMKSAWLSADMALTPKLERSEDPTYTKLVPKKDKTLEELKNDFESVI